MIGKNLPLLTSLSRYLTRFPNAVHEHTAVCYHASFAEDKQALFNLGYTLVHEARGLAMFFLHEESGRRLELIGQDRLEHEAWAVETLEEFDALNAEFSDGIDFEATKEFYDTPAFKAKLFRHTETGAAIQIVWRSRQIYPGLFSPDTVSVLVRAD